MTDLAMDKAKYAKEDHCETCCPWYPEPCASPFSEEFGGELQGNCQHSSCIVLDHPVGSELDHGTQYPWECLPWKADVSCCDDWGDRDEAMQLRGLTLAWNTMRTLTAGRIAAGCTELRPCLSNFACSDCYGSIDSMQPTLINGEWYNWPACRPSDCSCCNVCEIDMPGSVAALLEVNIDGYRHDPRLFRIDNGNQLVRMDGCCFPSCQNMGAPYGSYGTFGIRYVPGIVPTADGLAAVGALACEFAKACSGGKCRLPSGVTSLSRQGVSVEFNEEMFANGTGMREVDAYIFSVNPHRRRTQPKVWSPDLVSAKHRIRTGGPSGVWP